MALLCLTFFTTPAAAQTSPPAMPDYPRKPIRLVVPFAPGGNTDFLARMIGQKLGENRGQQVIPDNRPGAGGSVAGELVARAPPDGYTVLMISITNAIAATLHPSLPFDIARDFAPVILLATTPQALLAHPSLPVRTIRELITFSKARPGKLSYGSAGTGGGTHLTGELLKQTAGLDIVHIPYKGGGPALIDLVGGQIDLQVTGLVSAMPFIKSKRAHALAVTGAKRSPAAPEVPSMSEAGLPEVDASSWYGLVAPAATSREITGILNGEIARILAAPEMRTRLAADGAEPGGGTPEQFGTYISTEIAKWARVIRLANLRAQ